MLHITLDDKIDNLSIDNRLLNISKAYNVDLIKTLNVYEIFEKRNYRRELLSKWEKFGHLQLNSIVNYSLSLKELQEHELKCVEKTARYLRMYQDKLPKYNYNE